MKVWSRKLKMAAFAGILSVFILPLISQASTINVPTNFLVLNTGLMGWWTFDGPNMTGNVDDSSGNGNYGLLQNFGATSTATVIGKLGQALNFTAFPQYVQTTYTQTSVTAYSVSLWIKTTDKSAFAHPLIQDRGISGNAAGNSISMFIGQDVLGSGAAGQISFGLNSNGVWIGQRTTATINDGKWHHVVGTWSAPSGTAVASSQFTIYIDGVAVALNSDSFGTAPNSPLSGNLGATIGYGADSLYSSIPVAGYVDDVRIYTRTLSASEVRQLYNLGTANNTNASQAGPGTLGNGLVGWWTLGGKDTSWSSNTTNDLSGNGNSGTLVGMSTTTSAAAGKIGQALSFSNASTYVQLPNVSTYEFDNTNSFTVSAWINPSASCLTSGCTVFSTMDVSGNGGYVPGISTTGNLSMLVRSGTGASIQSSSGTISANKWTLATWVFTGPTSVAFYINGQPSGTGTFTQNLAKVSTPCYIGFNPNSSGSFNGKLNDIRVYNRALSASEIAELYAMTANVSANASIVGPGNLNSGLVGWWTFDGKDTDWTANTTNDISGNGNTGTMVNMSTTTSPVVGKVGQGLNFNGNSSCIRTNFKPSTYIGVGPYSISYWVYPNVLPPITQYHLGSYAGTGGLHIGESSSGQIQGRFNSSGSLFTITAAVLNTKSWNHIVVTSDGSAFNVYLNGVAKNTNNTYTASSDSYTLNIGCRNNQGTSDLYSNAIIDDVRIYNRMLLASEVQQLFNLGQ